MSSHSVNLQDSFLNQVRRDDGEVEITLANGTTFVGSVRGFDNFTVIVHTASQQHLVYKHAIARISAAKTLGKGPDDGEKSKNARSPKGKKPGKGGKHPGGGKGKEMKFNTMDFSHIKVEEQEKSGEAKPEPAPAESAAEPKPE